MQDSEHRSDRAAPPYPSAGRAWYAVLVLMLAYLFAFLDRQILSLLVQPIKRDLGISDTEMSLILGLAFGIFYTVLGIPIGRFGDRANRRNIVAAGIALWSVMTAACGLAASYAQLFLARVGVGFGEATLQPCALSLISDHFPRDKRGLAVSVYSMGLGLGAGLALVLGGQVVAAVANAPKVVLPLLGELYAWQTVFMVVGLPGLIVALLMLTVREPTRRDRNAGSVGAPFGTVLAYLWARRATYASHFVGLSVMTVIGNAVLAWMPAVFIRGYGWSIGQLSLNYGLVIALGGPAGSAFGGWLGDRLYRGGRKDGHMRAALYGTLVLVPAAVLAPLMPSPWLTVLLMVPYAVGSGMATASGPAALMVIAPNEMRAQVSALYWFVISTLGIAIGPLAVALLTDRLFHDEAKVGTALALVAAAFGAVVAGLLVYVLAPYRRAVAEAEAADRALAA
jgi:MFS family permease